MRSRPYLLTLLLAATSWAQDEADNPDWNALQKSAQAFVEAYNSADAEALGGLMTADAEMVRKDGSRISGRDEITSLYEGIFARNPEGKIALEASSVRFLSPRLAVEDGTLFLTVNTDGEPASFLYTALHVKQDDGTWLMARSRDREVSNLEAHERLDGIDGLVGDWIGRTDAGALTLTVQWDDSGSFLIGKARYTAAGLEPTTVTMRIGWNSMQNKINSWTFDHLGGFSQAAWTDTEDSWILKAHGYTNQGESTSSTQILQPTSSDSFRWSMTDKIIGDEVLPDRALNMVRQPPKPKVSSK